VKLEFEGFKNMENGNHLVKEDTTFLNIIDSLPVALIITNPDLSIRYVNTAFVRLTGFTLGDVKGTRAPYPWWPPDRHADYLDELNLVKQDKRHKSDWSFAAKDGHQFWIKANVAPVMADGKVQYMLACWTDISSNKLCEATLQKKLDDLDSSGS
jgi:two-component system, sensor histidine kinase and response regulator